MAVITVIVLEKNHNDSVGGKYRSLVLSTYYSQLICSTAKHIYYRFVTHLRELLA